MNGTSTRRAQQVDKSARQSKHNRLVRIQSEEHPWPLTAAAINHKSEAYLVGRMCGHHLLVFVTLCSHRFGFRILACFRDDVAHHRAPRATVLDRASDSNKRRQFEVT